MLLHAFFLCLGTAQALIPVNYGAFLPSATYSIANQLGFFTAYGLNVTYESVPNSTFAYANLLSGGYDILTGTIDNPVNLRFNSMENFTVLGQMDQGPDLVLATAPGITTIEQLIGKPIIVDSPTSGYADLLQKTLATFGLVLNRDYFFQTVGGTPLRYADLIAGVLPNGTEVFATILAYPYPALSQELPIEQRPNILARVSSVVAPITSSAYTARQSALEDCDDRELLTRFLGAMYTASLILLDPSKQACATAAIQAELNVTAATAALDYTAATDPISGELSGGNLTVNPLGLENIIAVREEFNGFAGVPAGFDFTAAIIPGEGKLIDYSIRDEALTTLSSKLLNSVC